MDGDRHGERVEVFRGEDGDWWWRAFAANGEQDGKSEEGFTDRGYAREDAERDNPGRDVVVIPAEDSAPG